MNNIFVPHELKTLTIDTEKRIFKVNKPMSQNGGEIMDQKKDVRIIRSNGDSLMQIGNEVIPIAGYTISTSQKGELCVSVTIKGVATEIEISTSLSPQSR